MTLRRVSLVFAIMLAPLAGRTAAPSPDPGIYSLGNYSMTGATTDLPDQLDPSVGFDLRYFTGAGGFARAMAPMAGEGVVWLAGMVVLPDESGRERMLAFYQRRRGLGEVLENGLDLADPRLRLPEMPTTAH